MSRSYAILAGLVLLVTAALAPGLREYRPDASTDSMVLEDDPESARYDRTAQMFVSDEFVLVGVRRDDLFEPKGVALIAELQERFAAIAFVRGEIAGPAAGAGLQELDRIVELGGSPVRYATLPDVLVKVCAGQGGGPVPFVVRRSQTDGTTRRVEGAIALPKLEATVLQSKVEAALKDRRARESAGEEVEELRQTVVDAREAFVREVLGAHYAEAVQSVLSIASAPLLRSFDPPIPPIQALARKARLGSEGISPQLAREELTESNLFGNNLISRDGDAAGVLVTLRPLPESVSAVRKRLRFLDRRATAREVLEREGASAEERAAAEREIAAVAEEMEAFRPEWVASEDARKQERIRIVRAVREVVEEYRARGEDIRASGVPALVVEMVEAIDGDLRVFSVASVGFLLVFLALIFRRIRWVVLPLLATGATVVWTISIMFALGKRITVITSNVPSLLLVIGLAHSIHLIVRYREYLVRHPDDSTHERVWRTVRSLVWPCLFTATTTSAGFLCLKYAGSRPIIDFGFLMAMGVGLAFVLSFILLPGLLILLPRPEEGRLERSAHALEGLGRASVARPGLVLGLASIITGFSILGIARLDVEARFIDYFSPDSPIHKGLTYIDENLGGTSGLEVILSAPEVQGAFGWQHPENLDRAARVSEWLAEQDEVGVVMSYVGLADEIRKVFPQVDRGRAGAFATSQLDASLFRPYVLTEAIEVGGRRYEPYSAVRIVSRVRETDPDLDRGELLARLREFLAKEFPPDASPEMDVATFTPIEAEATGMFVLYANMLQSLVGSQIVTSILALVTIWLMLALLFRNPFVALLALVPNAIPILFVLGAMGWADIPLDMATVMIASVSLGIGVDCAIHYLFRYREEVSRDGDVRGAILRSHGSIGTSILYTSLTTIVGFGVLAVSNFRPNAYFGVLTGFAMVAALFGMLTVLPVLVALLKPFGKATRAGAAKRYRPS